MSNNAAIAAVTATLTNMLQKAVSVDATVGGGKVTARPPDRARQGAAANQLNLFLYRTSIDAAWRNQDPSSIVPGEFGQPPLPLVLSYLITAYGENDEDILAHRLLGIAMSVLNDRPLLSRAEIATALSPAPGSGLEDQLERMRLAPHPVPMDEISRLWSTFGTGYRVSACYDAAVVLIDSTRPVLAPPPVLRRGLDDRGPTASPALLPRIDVVLPPNRQPAARPGDTVALRGRHLGSVARVQLTGIRLPRPVVLPVASTSPTTISVQIPAPPTVPAGGVAVAALHDGQAGGPIPSNAAPLALAPVLDSAAPIAAKLKGGAATVKLNCQPPVEPEQTIALILGDQVFPAPPLAAASTALTFAISGLRAGTYTARIRVDGVDSIPVSAPAVPLNADEPATMSVDPNQQVVLS